MNYNNKWIKVIFSDWLAASRAIDAMRHRTHHWWEPNHDWWPHETLFMIIALVWCPFFLFIIVVVVVVLIPSLRMHMQCSLTLDVAKLINTCPCPSIDTSVYCIIITCRECLYMDRRALVDLLNKSRKERQSNVITSHSRQRQCLWMLDCKTLIRSVGCLHFFFFFAVVLQLYLITFRINPSVANGWRDAVCDSGAAHSCTKWLPHKITHTI